MVCGPEISFFFEWAITYPEEIFDKLSEISQAASDVLRTYFRRIENFMTYLTLKRREIEIDLQVLLTRCAKKGAKTFENSPNINSLEVSISTNFNEFFEKCIRFSEKKFE